MYSTCTRVNARIPNARKSARRTKVGPTSRRAERVARAAAVGPHASSGSHARSSGPTAGHDNFRARIRVEVCEEVRVGVIVHVSPVDFSYYCTRDGTSAGRNKESKSP